MTTYYEIDQATIPKLTLLVIYSDFTRWSNEVILKNGHWLKNSD